MRRITLSVGALAAAAMMGLSGTGSAHAASGTLVINGTQYTDPSGCYPSGTQPLRVTNHTDAVAYVYTSPDCTGTPVAVLYQGEAVAELGRSVFVG
ncbi:hypothetical protein AB0C61_04450 [Streptomyces sp. NPDC048680]|uniref:hypothetical protein n=1 Tax=Streptomyces sp. NPDC048680 TaxID=3155492 RepID=UPI00344682C8